VESRGVGIVLIGPLPIVIESPDPALMMGLIGAVLIVFLAAVYIMLRRSIGQGG